MAELRGFDRASITEARRRGRQERATDSQTPMRFRSGMELSMIDGYLTAIVNRDVCG
jgi:hypothetical protein